MIEQMIHIVLSEMGVEQSPENKAKARSALYASMRDVLNTAYKMRGAQKRFFNGEKSLLHVCQALETSFDKMLHTLIDEKTQPTLF